MSKLERLNTRVTKLLTVAVHEVLEVVKETVSEYLQKTARTQRENESLKRRLQELQDELREANEANKCAPLAPSSYKTRQDEPVNQDELKQEPQLENSQRHDPNLTETKSKTLQMEPFNPGQLNCTTTTYSHAVECSTTVALQGEHDRMSNVTNAALTVYTSHSLHHEQDNLVGQMKSMSPSSLPMIKTESAPLPYSASHEHLDHNQLFMCGDLESGTVQNAGMPESMTDNTEIPGMVHYINTDGLSTFADSFQFECHSELPQGIRKPNYGKRLESCSCNICGKTFNRIGNLKIHQRCHTGEKPYSCLHCGKRFNHVGNLHKHKRIHTGERPYGCQQCGKTFSQSSHLRTHQKLHMNGR